MFCCCESGIIFSHELKWYTSQPRKKIPLGPNSHLVYFLLSFFSVNEKTGLLGQRVVTSQVREEFSASPTRDLYRALSPGYSPTGDLEWQDEFDFELGSGDQGFKQMLLPKLQMLQKHLINEFYDGDKIETKKTKLLESKVGDQISRMKLKR